MLLFLPMVVGYICVFSMSGYDGLGALLILTLVGAVAAGIWTGIKMMPKKPESTTGEKAGTFIVGLIAGSLAYVGINWVGCMAISQISNF